MKGNSLEVRRASNYPQLIPAPFNVSCVRGGDGWHGGNIHANALSVLKVYKPKRAKRPPAGQGPFGEEGE